MSRELLIIVYKINVSGLSLTSAEDVIRKHIEKCSLKSDEDLKDNYIIREMFIPIKESDSDVKVIYPLSSSFSSDIISLINEINDKIKTDTISDDIKKSWNKLLRELKIIKLYNKHVE